MLTPVEDQDNKIGIQNFVNICGKCTILVTWTKGASKNYVDNLVGRGIIEMSTLFKKS